MNLAVSIIDISKIFEAVGDRFNIAVQLNMKVSSKDKFCKTLSIEVFRGYCRGPLRVSSGPRNMSQSLTRNAELSNGNTCASFTIIAKSVLFNMGMLL